MSEPARELRERGRRLAEAGRYADAAAIFRRALQAAARDRARDSPVLVQLLNDYGVVCKYRGRFAEAARMYRKALRLARKAKPGGERTDTLATLCHNLGGIAHARGRLREGLRQAQRGIALRKTVRPRDAVALATDEAALAAILADLGRTAEAERTCGRVLRTLQRKLGPRHYEAGAVLANLGAIQAQRGRLGQAEQTLRRAIRIIEGALGRGHPRAGNAVRNLKLVRKARRVEHVNIS